MVNAKIWSITLFCNANKWLDDLINTYMCRCTGQVFLMKCSVELHIAQNPFIIVYILWGSCVFWRSFFAWYYFFPLDILDIRFICCLIDSTCTNSSCFFFYHFTIKYDHSFVLRLWMETYPGYFVPRTLTVLWYKEKPDSSNDW